MKCRLLWLPLALAACAPAPRHAVEAAPAKAPATAPANAAAATADASLLRRYHWQLEQATDRDGRRIDALFARPDKPLQLDFADGRLGVGNTCNRMSGSYEVRGARLRIGPLGQTMMACSDPALMALDAAVGERLRGDVPFGIEPAADAPRLRLATGRGDVLVFAGRPTAETRYGSRGETVFLEVAAQTAPCSHPLIPDMQCLQVRERRYDAAGLAVGTPGPWRPLYQSIEGYTHEPGVRNVLRVKRYAVAHPPADAPAEAYVLDMVVESEAVER
jgi:heat shock protein HslJ